jgi:hypothetical protein
MLGFGSHFAINGRHHMTTRVIGMLAFAGIGWHITADALLANTATGQAGEHRQVARAQLTTVYPI